MSMQMLDNANQLIYEGADWDYDKIKRAYDAIERIAFDEMGLDIYPNQIEVITAEQLPMIDPAVKQWYVHSSGISGLPLEINGYLFHKALTPQLRMHLQEGPRMRYTSVTASPTMRAWSCLAASACLW